MSRFDFDKIVNRRGTMSDKWDSAKNERVIPLWVADMDFTTAPCIIEALEKRVEAGTFGYTLVPDEFYNATIDWFGSRHGLGLKREWIIYTSGVVPAISACIKALTRRGDKVLVQTPVYNCFFSSIRNNGCALLENELVYGNGTYSIDFDDFEAKAADPMCKVFLLCNPHNPAGRVWSRDELERMGEICLRNGVTVIADEIHCELVYEGYRHTPFASVSDRQLLNSVTCVSPSKAFNTAGLQIANIITADESVRRKIVRAINDNEVCDVNPFGVTGLIAAYRHGELWLDELKSYLWGNYMFLKDFFAGELPGFEVTQLEGTYLVWVDCRKTGISSQEIADRLYDNHDVWINPGTLYGKAGEGFIRINIATRRALLAEALRRIADGLKSMI